MEHKKEWYEYLSLTKNLKLHSANEQVIDDLYLPDAFNTRIGERVSANFQQWVMIQQKIVNISKQ